MLLRLVLMTAQSSGLFPHTPLGFAHAFHGYSGVLMMLIQKMSAKEKKKAVRLATNRTACCAHDRSARFALQGVRRSRPRWELSGLIILRRFVRELSCRSDLVDFGSKDTLLPKSCPITSCSLISRRSLPFLSKS